MNFLIVLLLLVFLWMRAFLIFHKKAENFFHICLVRQPWQSLDDESLLLQYTQTLDKQMLGELFKRHSLLCFTVSMKYLKDEMAAEDAVMQIFEKLLLDLHKHEVKNFKSWLHSVTRNHCLMQLRKPQLFASLQTSDQENEDPFMESAMLLHQETDGKELEQKLQTMEQVLSELNTAQANCLRMFYLQGKTYEEVANHFGYSLNEVKSNIQNGKRNLKIGMAKRGITFMMLGFIWIQQSA